MFILSNRMLEIITVAHAGDRLLHSESSIQGVRPYIQILVFT